MSCKLGRVAAKKILNKNGGNLLRAAVKDGGGTKAVGARSRMFLGAEIRCIQSLQPQFG